MQYFNKYTLLSFFIGCGLYILIQTFISWSWESLYASGLDQGLRESLANGYMKPYFNLTGTSLLHTELIVVIATVIFCCVNNFRSWRSLIAFGLGIYLTAFIFGFFQNSDSNLWPLALFLFAFYFMTPVLLVGMLMLKILPKKNLV
jgi:hypothetical protein